MASLSRSILSLQICGLHRKSANCSITAIQYAHSLVSQEDKIHCKYDAVVVGGGHNGLIAAAYLAKKGLSVAVFEKRHVVGGAAVTEELIPGYKFSRGSYVLSLLRPQIIQDLKLKSYGLDLLIRETSSFTPMLEDGVSGKPPRSLLLANDPSTTYKEISKFSKKDAKAYQHYENFIETLANSVEFLLDTRITLNNESSLEQIKSLCLLFKLAKNLGSNTVAFYELMTSPIIKVLNDWFESEPLKATLATDGVIGAMLSPLSSGSGYVLLHHMIGQTNGKKGVWAYVRGGMGSVSNAIAACCKDLKVDVFVSQEVDNIAVKNGKAEGVILKSQQFVQADYVFCNTTPHVTFNKLLQDKDVNDVEYIRKINRIDYSSPVTKINVAVDSLPDFLAVPNQKYGKCGEQHMGTIHLNCENTDILHSAFLDCAQGFPSNKPMIEMCIPSALDNTLAPDGHHVISIFTQYTPITLKNGREWTLEDKQKYAFNVFDSIEMYAPGFKNSIVGTDVLVPRDLETIFGLTGGNIFHGAMSLDQLLFTRPTSVRPSHITPIQGLFLCGSGTHPGGGVMGSSGRLAALQVLNKGL